MNYKMLLIEGRETGLLCELESIYTLGFEEDNHALGYRFHVLTHMKGGRNTHKHTNTHIHNTCPHTDM